MTIRIILADDHEIVREGICALIEKDPDVEVVAQAGDGEMAVELAEKLIPDVLILDMSMPKMNGIDAMRKIFATTPQAKVIILSMHTDKAFVTRALKVGAQGYLIKDCAFVELMQAIRAVAAGQTYLSPIVTSSIVEEYVNQASVADAKASPDLTTREREVLQLIVEGKQTKDIANLHNVSIKTVETHRHRIMTKLNINSVSGLTKYALTEGLISLEK